MKVKNLFFGRKNKKKNTASVSSTSGSDKLIIAPDLPAANETAENNEQQDSSRSEVTVTKTEETVKIRPTKVEKEFVKTKSISDKDRTHSSSSNNSVKVKLNRRPWSFIEQFKRQNSRDSDLGRASSSSNHSENLLDFSEEISPICTAESEPKSRKDISDIKFKSSTLPIRRDNTHSKATTVTKYEKNTKRRSAGGATSSAGSSISHQKRPRTTAFDFRIFHFFKRSSSNYLPSPGVSSQAAIKPPSRHRNTINHRESSDTHKAAESPNTSLLSRSTLENDDLRLSDSGNVTSLSNKEPSKDNNRLQRQDRVDATFQIGGDADNDLAFDEIEPSFPKNLDATKQTTSEAEPFRVSLADDQRDSIITVSRSVSNSTETSSHRMSSVCDSIDIVLEKSKSLETSSPEDNPLLQILNEGQDCNTPISDIVAQSACSQSTSNIPTAGVLASLKPSPKIPRSSSYSTKIFQDTENLLKIESVESKQRCSTVKASRESMLPPSPVLRAIGYPGVVLRRHKHRRKKQRPNSAYCDQRTDHVLSLNVEDLPTYSRMRREMNRASSNCYPSFEELLPLQDTSTAAATHSVYGNSKKRVHAMQHQGSGTAYSVENLDSLSSSCYGSKQSLSDYSQIDDDECLNNYLAHAYANQHTTNGSIRYPEQSNKRVNTIRKSVASLANLISSSKPTKKIQRSSSFKESATTTAAVASFKPYRPPSNTPNKKNKRKSKLWCEIFDNNGLSDAEVRWQEAIFELHRGEKDLVEDLTMAKKTYRDSMVTLKMLTDDEVTLIFGKLGCLLPLHRELLDNLTHATKKDGRILAIGQIFVDWFPRISNAYREYCSNQSDAKSALDKAIERDPRVRDFLQRCLESPFSRKLDLWSYLDLPRTRLVKYPLLLKNILKRTPGEYSEERSAVEKAMDVIGGIIERVDEKTGEQQCIYIRSKFEYLDDKQRSPLIENSKLLLCSGQLKSVRGTKLHVFLFEEVLVLTRQATRSNKTSYQIYRRPLPIRSLVADFADGENRLSGSFRGGILTSEKAKHAIRVHSEELNLTYTLQASEEHDRKQWVNALQEAFVKYRERNPSGYENSHNRESPRPRATTFDITSSRKADSDRVIARSSSDKSHNVPSNMTDYTEERRSRSQTTFDSGSLHRRESFTQKLFGRRSLVSRDSSSKQKYGSCTDLRRSSDTYQSELRDTIGDIRKRSSLTGVESFPNDSPKFEDTAKRQAKRVQQCRRSRSLNSSPHLIRSVVARFRTNKLVTPGQGNPDNDGKLGSKPPISPFNVRRSTSHLTSIHETKSTPNLMVARSNCHGQVHPAALSEGRSDSKEEALNSSQQPFARTSSERFAKKDKQENFKRPYFRKANSTEESTNNRNFLGDELKDCDANDLINFTVPCTSSHSSTEPDTTQPHTDEQNYVETEILIPTLSQGNIANKTEDKDVSSTADSKLSVNEEKPIKDNSSENSEHSTTGGKVTITDSEVRSDILLSDSLIDDKFVSNSDEKKTLNECISGDSENHTHHIDSDEASVKTLVCDENVIIEDVTHNFEKDVASVSSSTDSTLLKNPS